jgi:hypothetical protein
MALRSRRQRDLEQKRRMARGRRNLSQLAGPVAQGQRTPMNRGSGSVSTVQAPKFQQSDPGGDITQAGLAYKGAKGLFDFTQGKEAYTDAAGNAIKAREPWTIGGETIPEKISGYNTGLGNFGKNVMNMEPGYAIGKGGEVSSSMFGAPWEPISMGGSGGGLTGLASTPDPFASLTGGGSMGNSGLLAPQAAQAAQAGSPAYFQQLQNLNPMSNAVSASSVGSNLPISGNSAFSGGANLGGEAVTGLSKAPDAAKLAESQMGDMMGTAGSALGAGLNIYDMTQQGVTAGNALGLGGSALLGLSNAWNPLGWAMLGTSTAGSLFDWW